jgi:peptidase E
MTRQIIALGGGGFSVEPDNPLLDQYVLRCSGVLEPKVCFVATAAGDSLTYIERFYTAFKRHHCAPTHLDLFRPSDWTLTPEQHLETADVLYFSGGNTRNALALWREWKLLEPLRAAYERGAVFAGISAGANAWFEQCTTDSLGPGTQVMACLGWLSGSMTPHFDGEPERRPALHQALLEGRIKPGYAVDDYAALHFKDEALHGVVTSRPGAGAYRVALEGTAVSETRLETQFLGAVE